MVTENEKCNSNRELRQKMYLINNLSKNLVLLKTFGTNQYIRKYISINNC